MSDHLSHDVSELLTDPAKEPQEPSNRQEIKILDKKHALVIFYCVNSGKEIEYRVVEKFDEKGQLLRRAWYLPRSEALHRISGPAVEMFDASTGRLTQEIQSNQFDRWPPKRLLLPGVKSAKEVEYRVLEKMGEKDQLLRRTWSIPHTGATHRVGGPAVEIFDPASGKLTGEIWIDVYRHGKHRDGNLPSEISVDPVSNIIVIEEFYHDNHHHRDDGGPTEIYRDSVTGHVTMLVYCYEGLRDREGDQAAVQEFSPEDGRLLREEFYTLGQRHRESGPAIIEYDFTGKPVPSSLEYYRHGKKIHANKGFVPTGP